MALRVSDLMTAGVFAVRAEDDLATVRDIMDERAVRHVPVVDEVGFLVGLVSQRDLLRSTLAAAVEAPPHGREAALRNTTAGEVMTSGVVTAAPEQDIRTAARVMLENKYGCLPVVDGARLVGIVTEADFVRFLAAGD
jgi:CBS domain-containing membrane protein